MMDAVVWHNLNGIVLSKEHLLQWYADVDRRSDNRAPCSATASVLPSAGVPVSSPTVK